MFVFPFNPTFDKIINKSMKVARRLIDRTRFSGISVVGFGQRKMVLIKVGILMIIATTLDTCSGGHHHVHHRIHVPTKIKTIYHTKIIKVPEHHHYITEKEKPHLVKVPEHHHYFHEKEKEHGADLYDYHKKDDDDDYLPDLENDHRGYGSHNIYKKHAPTRRQKKRKH